MFVSADNKSFFMSYYRTLTIGVSEVQPQQSGFQCQLDVLIPVSLVEKVLKEDLLSSFSTDRQMDPYFKTSVPLGITQSFLRMKSFKILSMIQPGNP